MTACTLYLSTASTGAPPDTSVFNIQITCYAFTWFNYAGPVSFIVHTNSQESFYDQIGLLVRHQFLTNTP